MLAGMEASMIWGCRLSRLCAIMARLSMAALMNWGREQVVNPLQHDKCLASLKSYKRHLENIIVCGRQQ